LKRCYADDPAGQWEKWQMEVGAKEKLKAEIWKAKAEILNAEA
jgi:hypothetical protein